MTALYPSDDPQAADAGPTWADRPRAQPPRVVARCRLCGRGLPPGVPRRDVRGPICLRCWECGVPALHRALTT